MLSRRDFVKGGVALVDSGHQDGEVREVGSKRRPLLVHVAQRLEEGFVACARRGHLQRAAGFRERKARQMRRALALQPGEYRRMSRGKMCPG